MKNTLVFSGSGVLFPAHLGAAQRLFEAGYHPQRFVGTSGGAIVATYLAAGNKPKDGVEFVREHMPREMLSFNWLGFLTNWGAFNLNKLHKTLETILPAKFCYFRNDVCVVTTDVNTQQQVVFSPGNTPNVSPAMAVQASASIPFVFSPVKLDGRLLTDGGVVNMLAVDLFPGDPVIGIRVQSAGSRVKPPKNIAEYAMSVVGAMLQTMEQEHMDDATYASVIDIVLPFSSTDFFGFDDKALGMLYNLGYSAVSRKISEGWKGWSR